VGSPRALRVAGDARQDLVRRLGPHEWRGIFVVDVDVFTNGCFQVFHAAKHAPSYPFVGEFGEPSFDQVDPGTVGRCEVNMEAGTLGEPFPDKGRFVRAVVVHHDMNVESGRYLIFDQVEEAAKLHGAMTVTRLADYVAGLQLQRRKQRSCSVTFVIVRATLYLPGLERQQRLRTVQRLNLAVALPLNRGLLESGSVCDP
jgi:hypothetical protein